MATQLDRPVDVRSIRRPRRPPTVPCGRGIAWALLGIAVFLFVFAAAHNMRAGGSLTDRVRNPAVQGHPRPVRPLFGDTAVDDEDAGRDRRDDVPRRHPLRRDVAAPSEASDPVDGARMYGDRLDGPDHELGALRGLQPAAVALARVVAAGFVVADRRAARRVRLCDVLSLAVLSGDVPPAPVAADAAGRLVRLAASARQHGVAHLRDRLRLRRGAGDLLDPRRAVHLFAGHPVRVGVRGQALSVPVDLGVGARDRGDDPGRRAAVPRRHGEDAGREAGACACAGVCSAAARRSRPSR